MKTIIECVPNFSEGRDPAVIDQIVAAIQSVPGLVVMDIEMDADHHRSVITFVGEKDRVGEGALQAIGAATELIDLNRHSGAHPRIGATDVVPFIPVRGVTLEECVAIARQVGAEAARRFSIPIYLYEAAATRPERVQLENIRRGQFEGLRQEIESSDDRLPDFGVPRLHPTAGATIVGARKFLIAYNINLDTPDLGIAKSIAKAIRFSSGGLRFVKAMGVDLKARNQAQVSMNLTDFEQTPIHRVFETVKHEAERYGVTIAGSEIVGLVPQKALEMSAEYYLQIENFRAELVFENRLNILLEGSPDLAAMKIADFLDSVSATTPAPGGGSVAALAGALAAALGRMAIGFTLHRKKFEDHKTKLLEHLGVLEESLAELRQAVDRDAQAYSQVVAAQQLPKGTESEKQVRALKLQEALRHATEVPMKVAEVACRVMQSLLELRSISNPNVASDLNVGFWMALAAAEGALENVMTNLESLPESEFVTAQNQRLQELKSLLKALGTAHL
jgi:glutamate formiminotransferase / formiminotetrahydrofolate cyclodeaminase